MQLYYVFGKNKNNNGITLHCTCPERFLHNVQEQYDTEKSTGISGFETDFFKSLHTVKYEPITSAD